MQAIKHDINHQYQPSNHSCVQTATSMLLGHYGHTVSVEELLKSVPILKNKKGEEIGTINQQVATWCISQGYNVALYTFDFQIIDLSWGKLPADKIVERLEAVKNERNVPSIGQELSEAYVQSYIDFIKAGGQLHILPYPTSRLYHDLLEKGPFLLSICFNVLWDQGRTDNTSLRQSTPNDISGHLANHSIVVYGRDKKGDFLIADPWEQPGHHTVEPERLLAATTAALMECDNLLFQLSK
jgi:hypothetical protein